MKTNGFIRTLLVVSILAFCMLGICSAAVSVEDVTSVVGPQVNLTAEVTDMEATSYQWYTCEDAEGTSPKAIEGATNKVYTTPYLDIAGETYYMVKVNNTESAVATVTATMPEKPVVFRFNDEKDLSYWSVEGKEFTTYNGENVFSYATAADGITYIPTSASGNFYIQGYPYVVIGAYYPDHTNNTADIYLGTDRVPDDEKAYGFSASYAGMFTVSDGTFSKTVIDAETRQYITYAGDTVFKSGTASGDGFGGFDKWMGKITSFRLDFSNANAGKKAYISYVGFFPTKEMAIAYNGEMLYDEDMASITDALDAAYDAGDMDISYESAATEATANAFIADLVEELTADAVEAIKAKNINNVKVEIVSTKYTPAENYWENGSYTFTMKFSIGDTPLQRSADTRTYTVALKAKDMGKVFIPDVTSPIGAPVTFVPKLTDVEATSYQWYTCEDTNGTNSVAIAGATGATYTTPNLNTMGSYYYKVVVNGTEEAVVAVSVGMPTKPVVFKFNNSYDLANWSAGDTKKLVTIDGTTAFAYTPASNDGATTFSNLNQYNDFYLQGYPYFVVSASYPDHEKNTFDIYIGADGYDPDYRKEHYNFNFSVSGVNLAVNKGFCKTVISAKDGSFKSYDKDGKVVASGKGSPDGFKDYTTLIGKLAVLRLDVSNGNANKECYIEYLGFFPTEEMAVAYNGEMPEDKSADLLIGALEDAEANGELSMRFVNAENEAMVRQNASAAVEALTANTITELKKQYNTVEFSVGEATYSRTSPYGRGTYEFEAKALVGDKVFGRSLLSTNVTMELLQKPDPVIMTFDTEEKVKNAAVSGVTTKSLVTEGERKFMRLYHKGLENTSSHVEMNYTNFYDQTGKVFNFQDYPYMKVSYRRNVPKASADAILVYAASNSPSFRIDTAYDMTTWNQLVVDMRQANTANSISFYADGAATPSSYGKLQYINSTRNWTAAEIAGDTTPLEFRLSRYGSQARTIDYEYIAFFASYDEAKMYPERLPENASYDVENLKANNSFRAGAGVVTKAQAEEAAKDYLSNFVFATNHNVDTENAIFTPPSSKGEGTYKVDVWFGTERKEEFTVTLTVTLDSLPAPVIMFADSTAVFNSVKADNAKLTLENGVIKMKVSNPANDDGFFLLTKYPGSMPSFKATTLPYLKMRYTISGITKDTSGNPVNPTTVQAQFFIWFTTGYNAVPYKCYYPYGANFEDGDEIEVIVDTSYITAESKSKPGVWVRNITKGETEYTAKNFGSYRNEDGSDSSKPAATGKAIRDNNSKFKEVRLNLARTKNLNRSAEFVYAGYFASLDEAKAFDSDVAVAEKLQAAENKLRELATSDVVIPWAEVAKERTEVPDSKATVDADGNFVTTGVKSQTVMAMLGLRQWINSYIGAEGNVEISDYVPATTTTKGSITFSMDLESAYQKRSVKNVTANFSEKPDDYFVWRFNDPEIISKGSFPKSANDIKIEDNVLKMDHKNPIDSSSFNFTLWPAVFNQPTFNFESHSYILMKYKREGDISPCSFTFINANGEQNSISNVGWGWYSGDWYYTLYDTNIRDRVTPHSYNYNLTTGKMEDINYHKSYAAPTAAPFKGELRSLAFDFGARWFADRSMEIEFIAFFPSMADARNYVENIEKLEDAISDTAIELKDYKLDYVTYYDANTQEVAEAKAKAIIEDKVSAPGVDVTINTVSYTAPTDVDGTYAFNAVITLDGEHVYTTENISFAISHYAENYEAVYKFTNPRFVQGIEGASKDYDFFGMTLNGNYFVLEVGADKPNVVDEAYQTLALDAKFEGGFTAIINGSKEIVYEGDADGVVYLALGEFAGNIDTVKVVFNNYGAYVRALGFFADEAAAKAYDLNEIPWQLADAAATLDGTHSYGYNESKTISDVKAHSQASYIPGKVGADILVADIQVTKYEHSTPTETGYAEVTTILGYGDKTATQYTTVTYPIILAKDAEVITATPVSIGHEFLGYDVITANNNFSSVPGTVEFNIMVASAKLTGTMPILNNGSTSISLVDGKIVAGALTSATVLTADTWTHVAITSDGKIYINGKLDATGSNVSFAVNAPVIGGGTSAGKGFIGHLLDLRFWGDVRTAEEIAANMDERKDSEDLLANWMLNAENYKWLEYFDASENNNTATFKSYGWYKMEAGWQGDYSFIHYGDTQSHFAIAPRSYKRIPDVFEWIGNNVEKYNIAHVSILGDATQNNTRFEWGVIREAHRFIDGKTTYHLPLGNHDYPSPSGGVGAEIRDTTHYREAFPYDEYVATYGPDGMNTFGGTFRDEKDLTNMYNLVTAGGVDYIFFSLEYGPRDAVLEWVGDVLTQYPERQAIISTHCYFSMDGTLTTANSTTNREFSDGNEGLAMYQKLVTKYPNIIIVDCGHSQGDDSKQHPHQRGSSYKDSPTADDFGNDVVQILSDASAYALEYLKNDVAFGADEGLIFVMMFEDNGRTMHTYVYSPLHDAYFRSVNEQTHTIKEIKAEPSLNVVGTEMREQTTDETLGMRFKMTLSKSFANFGDEIEVLGYGVVAVPEDLIEEGAEVTADILKGTPNAEFVKIEECSDTIFYEDDSRIDFTVVIHDVPEDDGGFAYARQFKARAYVDYTVNGGEVQRLYSFKTLTCSMNSLIND